MNSFAAYDFDWLQANRDLHEINLKLEHKNLSLSELHNYRVQLDKWKEESIKCVEAESHKLSELSTLEKDLQGIGKSFPAYEQDLKFIQEKQQITSTKLFSCRMFDLQANEARYTSTTFDV